MTDRARLEAAPHGCHPATAWTPAIARLVGLATVFLLLIGGGSAEAATRILKFTLQPSGAACTGWDQLDCSYLEARNGNAPAPDPATDPSPTFLNMANLPGEATMYAALEGSGAIEIKQRHFRFPAHPTTLENALVGTVQVRIQVEATGDWRGNFDQLTGAMALSAPIGLDIKLNCDQVLNALCGAIFGPDGNMGTWRVIAKGPADPLTTGALTAPAPPASYGPAWLGPVVESGTAFDADGVGTLINNDLEIEKVDSSDCVDSSSYACSNSTIGNLVAPQLNAMLGTVYDPVTAANDRDSMPGAIDMRLTFAISEMSLLTSDFTALTFPGSNEDGTQTPGTASPAVSTTLKALDTGDDIQIISLHTDGGDEDDFILTSSRPCVTQIDSGASCRVALRFLPSGTGPRSSTLYASIVNPLTGETEKIELATLSGEGGNPPKEVGPPNDRPAKPDPSPPSEPGQTPDKGDRGETRAGALVEIRSRVRVKLRSKPMPVAAVAARVVPVKLWAPKRARVRIGSHRFAIRVHAPNGIGIHRRAKIRLMASRRIIRSLRDHGPAKLRLPLIIRSGDRTQKHVLRIVLR